MKKFLLLFLCFLLGAGFAMGSDSQAEALNHGKDADVKKAYEDFLNAVSTQFGYDVAYTLSMDPNYHNSSMGGRTAGSVAEHKAADYLTGVMKEIGLEEVEKQAAPCDLWQFNGAELTIDGKNYPVYSYATAATPKEGIGAEVIYLQDGTMWDYEGVDANGKIVLIDIDMRANWWVTYPMLEAQLQGAAAILSANVGGFSQVADDALNCQDICAPVGIPCLSISLKDSREIQEKLSQGPVKAHLMVDNVVELGKTGTTYNVTGKIKGESSDFQILVGAHYDTHFYGFQDDSCAAGLVLSMAKAMVDSGFKPKNDLVFVLHGAEEWGASGTQYDWCVGAWEMINTLHPEWAEKTLAFVNFELPAYEFDTYTSTYSAPEMYKLLDTFANGYAYSPKPEGCFPDDVKTAGYQTYTYSDDFSYYAAGVPSTVNGFLLKDDMATPFDFYIQRYHSQYDLPETYNEAVMAFNTKYYGALVMYLDRLPALCLDFTAQYDRILASLDAEIITESGGDTGKMEDALTVLKDKAEAMNLQVQKTNQDYLDALEEGNSGLAGSLWAKGRDLTRQNLKAFGFAQDELLGLMYERPIVPHEAPQENILLMQKTIEALEDGKVAEAADEYAWAINNVLEWYAMYFSPEVIQIQDDMFYAESNQDNLYWGTDKAFVKAEVEEATRSLMLRYEEEGGDFSQEIAVYQNAIDSQRAVLLSLFEKEIQDVEKLASLLETN
ncbi:MAG: M28 family peptidase [Bacillota bacterium]|nr:M28 family peptidase [Bacillota bacterium]